MELKFSHIYRKGNQAAANLAVSTLQDDVWIELHIPKALLGFSRIDALDFIDCKEVVFFCCF